MSRMRIVTGARPVVHMEGTGHTGHSRHSARDRARYLIARGCADA